MSKLVEFSSEIQTWSSPYSLPENIVLSVYDFAFEIQKRFILGVLYNSEWNRILFYRDSVFKVLIDKEEGGSMQDSFKRFDVIFSLVDSLYHSKLSINRIYSEREWMNAQEFRKLWSGEFFQTFVDKVQEICDSLLCLQAATLIHES